MSSSVRYFRHSAGAVGRGRVAFAGASSHTADENYDICASVDSDFPEDNATVDGVDAISSIAAGSPDVPESVEDEVLAIDVDSSLLNNSPFWIGSGRLIDHHNSARNGISAKFTIASNVDGLPHPFRGLKSGYSSGHRLHIRVCTDTYEPVPVYDGEGMLAYWNEDFGGCHFSIKFDDGPDGVRENPFQVYRFGKGDGDLFTLALWLIDDQEEVVLPKVKKSFAEISPTQQSQILCKSDSDFQVWVIKLAKKRGFVADGNALAYENAGNAVKFLCDIKSRSELSKDSFAKAKWNELLGQFRARNDGRF